MGPRVSRRPSRPLGAGRAAHLAIACATGHAAWATSRLDRLALLVCQTGPPLTPAEVTRAAAADALATAQGSDLDRPSLKRLEAWERSVGRERLELDALHDALLAELERRRTR